MIDIIITITIIIAIIIKPRFTQRIHHWYECNAADEKRPKPGQVDDAGELLLGQLMGWVEG